jgi:hypothetical protein
MLSSTCWSVHVPLAGGALGDDTPVSSSAIHNRVDAQLTDIKS